MELLACLYLAVYYLDDSAILKPRTVPTSSGTDDRVYNRPVFYQKQPEN